MILVFRVSSHMTVFIGLWSSNIDELVVVTINLRTKLGDINEGGLTVVVRVGVQLIGLVFMIVIRIVVVLMLRFIMKIVVWRRKLWQLMTEELWSWSRLRMMMLLRIVWSMCWMIRVRCWSVRLIWFWWIGINYLLRVVVIVVWILRSVVHTLISLASWRTIHTEVRSLVSV